MAENVPRMGERATLIYEMDGERREQTFELESLTYRNVWKGNSPGAELLSRSIDIHGRIFTDIVTQQPPKEK